MAIRPTSAAAHELKHVAHLIGFKIWAMLMQKGLVNDAIEHFQRHVRTFASIPGVGRRGVLFGGRICCCMFFYR